MYFCSRSVHQRNLCECARVQLIWQVRASIRCDCATVFPYLVHGARFDGITSFFICRCQHWFLCLRFAISKISACDRRRRRHRRHLKCVVRLYEDVDNGDKKNIVRRKPRSIRLVPNLYSHAHLHLQQRSRSPREACSRMNNTQIPVTTDAKKKKRKIARPNWYSAISGVHTRSPRFEVRLCARAKNTHNFSQWERVGIFFRVCYAANWSHFHLNMPHWKKWNDSHTHWRTHQQGMPALQSRAFCVGLHIRDFSDNWQRRVCFSCTNGFSFVFFCFYFKINK